MLGSKIAEDTAKQPATVTDAVVAMCQNVRC